MYVKEHDRTVRIDVLLKVNPTREGDPHSHRASLLRCAHRSNACANPRKREFIPFVRYSFTFKSELTDSGTAIRRERQDSIASKDIFFFTQRGNTRVSRQLRSRSQ